MSAKFKIGDQIKWKWAGGTIFGSIEEIFYTPTVKQIKGKKIKRNGSSENPAYLVRSRSGNIALKLQTELTASSADEVLMSQILS